MSNQPITETARCFECESDLEVTRCNSCSGTGCQSIYQCQRCNGWGDVWRCQNGHEKRRLTPRIKNPSPVSDAAKRGYYYYHNIYPTLWPLIGVKKLPLCVC